MIDSSSSLRPFKGRILVIDDQKEMRLQLVEYLSQQGYSTFSFSTPGDALEALSSGGEFSADQEKGDLDLVIADIQMPGMSGIEFTSRLHVVRPEIPIIHITGFGSIETAIDAMRHGAFHYVVKPFAMKDLLVNVERALEHRKLQLDNSALRQEIKRPWSMGGMIGKSASLKNVFELIRRVSQVGANVLITGESGTGKEMVARAIHQGGPRAHKPFIAINCSAIPETLLESELFGHAKGSFTGAIQRRRGLFEEADGGTLFLDEIGDMNVQLQAKLLRVIQDRRVRAVGENTDREIDVRIISATHKDLKLAMREGRFRDDLYYRLSVIPIVIPPLRHRREDIPILAEHFLRKYSATNNLSIKGFTQGAMAKLVEMKWEGNVRELENVVERATVLASGHMISESDLPVTDEVNSEDFFGSVTRDFPTLDQLEKRYIQATLEKTGNRKDQAAHILGINRRTLYRKEREYGFVDQRVPQRATQRAT